MALRIEYTESTFSFLGVEGPCIPNLFDRIRYCDVNELNHRLSHSNAEESERSYDTNGNGHSLDQDSHISPEDQRELEDYSRLLESRFNGQNHSHQH